MKYFFLLATMLVVSSSAAPYYGGITNFCGQYSCCSTPACNICASNCPFQCSSQACTNNCIENCIQGVPQICNGGTCNICSGSQCCSSQYCNNCASTCTSQCLTPTCTNNCVSKCIDTTPNCVGANCNVCVGGQCCSNETCNNCVNQCYQQTSGCTRNCVNQCIQPNPIKIALPLPETDCEGDDAPDVIVIHGNQSRVVNVTTTINLYNVINNTNLIHVPVHANNTNINHVHVSRKPPQTYGGKQSEELPRGGLKAPQDLPPGCCYVYHPRECFYEQKNQTERELKCIRRRHRECSALCTSSEVMLNPEIQHYPRPLLPTYEPQQRCHFVQQYPWVYCRNNQSYNCAACYYCNQGYHPQLCSTQPNCPLVCRR